MIGSIIEDKKGGIWLSGGSGLGAMTAVCLSISTGMVAFLFTRIKNEIYGTMAVMAMVNLHSPIMLQSHCLTKAITIKSSIKRFKFCLCLPLHRKMRSYRIFLVSYPYILLSVISFAVASLITFCHGLKLVTTRKSWLWTKKKAFILSY